MAAVRSAATVARSNEVYDDIDEEVNPELLWRWIAMNDSGIVNLLIGRGFYLPNDWERDGKCIGKNTRLKELHLIEFEDREEPTGTEFEQFFRGVALNRSIKKLYFRHCRLFKVETFHILSSFIGRNQRFETLEINGCIFDHRIVGFFLSAIAKTDSLKGFVLSYCYYLRDNEAAGLIWALKRHSRLKELSLSGNCLRRNSCTALSELVRNSNSKLIVLNLFNSHFDDETAAILATALEGGSKLAHLNLGSNQAITFRGWQAIFNVLRNPSSRIRELDLSHNSFCDATITYLAHSIASSRSVASLGLSSSNKCITVSGWRAFFSLFRSPDSVLEELDLLYNALSDIEAVSLASSLANNTTLRTLKLCNNPRIMMTGCDNRITGETAILLACSLARNNKVRELLIDTYFEDPDDIWATFSRILCNDASIMETYTSNHTLRRVCWLDGEDYLPDDLIELLRLNRENSEREAARLKIMKVHFNSEFDMQPFIAMELKLLPCATAWMAKVTTDTGDRGNVVHSPLYHFVRSIPLLFDIDGRAIA